MIKVNINKKNFEIEKGSTVTHAIEKSAHKSKYPTLGAFLNNELVDLGDKLKRDCKIVPIDIKSPSGLRIYSTSLYFVMVAAAKKLFPKDTLMVQHSLSGGLFMEFKKRKLLSFKDIEDLKREARKIIKADKPIKKETVDIEEAIEYFKSLGQTDKMSLFKNVYSDSVTLYSLNGEKAFFYGPLVLSTGVLKTFDLRYYPGGMLLLFPNGSSPDKVPPFREQKKIFEVFHEFEDWQNVLNVCDVGSLNKTVMNGQISQLIKISEVIHEKKISYIADKLRTLDKVKLVLIAGPSSSGKTTFTKRLSIHLQVVGLKTSMISLDDYFVERDKTPVDKDGNNDFEHIDAIDIQLFNEHLIQLFQGKTVELPAYNFKTGKREFNGHKLHLERDQVILVEGIHGLNPKLTHYIPEIMKFKVYVSALTQLNIDSNNRIPTTDSRLIRRMVRDAKFRNYKAEDTLKRWPSVRRGEGRWIFPFQENADMMFNSALLYELAVLKGDADAILREIDMNSPVYYEAKRLRNFLSYFVTLPPDEIPPTSILKEFLGGGSFSY